MPATGFDPGLGDSPRRAARTHDSSPPRNARRSGGLRLSIVIPSYNQAEFLEDTLKSILAQESVAEGDVEIIVIDGGSNDGSVEIIERYAAQVSYWVSEPDEGQTHALIKGFAAASGDIMGWLCSDDLLEPTAARDVIDYFTWHPDEGFVYGDSCWIGRDGRFLRWKKEIPFNWFIWVHDHNYIPQPSTFWRRDLYEEAGGLRQEFNLAMDADLFARFARIKPPRHVRRLWSRARFYPEQKNQRLRAQSNLEDLRIRRELGYRVDRAASRAVLRLLAKTFRICWKLVTGCYW